MTDEQEPPAPPTERDESVDRTGRNVAKPRRLRRVDGDSSRPDATPPHRKAALFQPGNRKAAGRAQPIGARNPIEGFDRLIKRVIGRLLYTTKTEEKGGKKHSTRFANPVTANMVNAVVNAVRLQIDIFSQFQVAARLEQQTAELAELMDEMQRLKRRQQA